MVGAEGYELIKSKKTKEVYRTRVMIYRYLGMSMSTVLLVHTDLYGDAIAKHPNKHPPRI